MAPEEVLLGSWANKPAAPSWGAGVASNDHDCSQGRGCQATPALRAGAGLVGIIESPWDAELQAQPELQL